MPLYDGRVVTYTLVDQCTCYNPPITHRCKYLTSNDEQLFLLLKDKDGNEDAFNAIFERYRKRLYIEAYIRLQNALYYLLHLLFSQVFGAQPKPFLNSKGKTGIIRISKICSQVLQRDIRFC